ncbi:MAG: hypothetical protein ABSB59_02410 [Streptosporangiaceae bacterium]
MGVGRKTARKRAVGTREHIISYLTEVSELFDANGMASTRLAAAVGYPGSSVAFAQLLSGMERSGLIEREVRGKRTYRIRLGPVAIAGPGGPGSPGGPGGPGGPVRMPGQLSRGVAGAAGIAGAGGIPAPGTAGFDYDELARRLLVQVVRRLGATDPEASQPGPSELQQTVTGLEYELATAWTKHGKLAEENVRLREQLRAAQHSLALAAERVRKLPVSTGLDSSEVVLLQRLLNAAEAAEAAGAGEAADSPDDSDAETTSLAG